MKNIDCWLQELHQELIKTKDELLEMIESNRRFKIIRTFKSPDPSFKDSCNQSLC